MKLGSLFGKPKTLASSKKQVPVKESKLAVEMEKRRSQGNLILFGQK
ncbi:hypothetical protein AAHB46_08250 [Bacillus paranthracis]